MIGDMQSALLSEINSRQHYLNNTGIDSIYFGGGTPSMVPHSDIHEIVNEIQSLHQLAEGCEITLEANPDDITAQTLSAWQKAGINRISLGIQSFHDDDLHFMNRAHDGNNAHQALNLILESGIDNCTVDIIFGFEGLTQEKLIYNLDQIVSKNINHISCYALTIEPKTVLHHKIKSGEIKQLDDETSASHFELIKSTLESHGFDHYEISNYARQNKYAKHNTNYWKNKPYLGIGPSAHSYNGKIREWNIANNATYIKSISGQVPFSEAEELSVTDFYNEYLMTGLRTKWGVTIEKIKSFGPEYHAHFMTEIQLLQTEDLVYEADNVYRIKSEKLILCDSITSRLFFV